MDDSPSSSAPEPERARRSLLDRLRSRFSPSAVRRRRAFERVHRENAWGCEETRSGPGSTLERTKRLREDLATLLRELGVRSVLDAGCGDFHWASHADLPVDRWIGVDVVPALVEETRRRFGSAAREFLVADVVRDRLPRADAVLCRECLVHLPLADGVAAIENFRRSGAAWLLATTFPGAENADAPPGGWRPLDLGRPPFSLGEPTRRLSEAIPGHPRKALGAWPLRGPARATSGSSAS